MKRIACVFLSLMLVSAMIVGMTGQAATLSHGDYQYTLNEDGTAVLTKYLGSQTDLTLPDSLDGHPLTGIGNNAFYQSPALCSVMLPAGVKAIGASAFALCPELETVPLPEGLERIGYSAFFQCPFLKEVSLPATLLEIQSQAFSNCEGLTEISVDPRNETWKAIDGVLFSKDGSQLHTYPAGRADASYAIPEGTQVIAGGVLRGGGAREDYPSREPQEYRSLCLYPLPQAARYEHSRWCHPDRDSSVLLLLGASGDHGRIRQHPV